jgi:hypothetical protein
MSQGVLTVTSIINDPDIGTLLKLTKSPLESEYKVLPRNFSFPSPTSSPLMSNIDTFIEVLGDCKENEQFELLTI